MTVKELKQYIKENNMRPGIVDDLKSSGLKRSDDIYKELEKRKETIADVERLVDEADRHRYAYFFHPSSCAGMRRQYERVHSVSRVYWEEGGNWYSGAFDVSCSCRYVRTEGDYYKNGKKTTLKAIRCSLNRMKKDLYLPIEEPEDTAV